MPNPSKVWFITGSSRGFGRVWTEAALRRGDRVAATARTLKSIADLRDKYGDLVLPLELDVTNSQQAKAAVEKAHAHFGRLDVIVNNAGYALVGFIEEASADQIREQYETNVLGSLAVIKAVMPLLREQGGGHILGISSALGHVSMPWIGYYCSSKWAFEAIHESLAAEVKAFGVKVTIVEPGAYATEFGGPASGKMAANLEAYDDLRKAVLEGMMHQKREDPNTTSEALFQIVDTGQPPLRIFLGSGNLPWVRSVYTERLKTWEAWESVASSGQGNTQSG